MGAQVVLFSILPVRGKGVRRRALISRSIIGYGAGAHDRVLGSITTVHFLQTFSYFLEMGSTLLSKAEISLPSGCLSW